MKPNQRWPQTGFANAGRRPGPAASVWTIKASGKEEGRSKECHDVPDKRLGWPLALTAGMMK
jgi:hypothetical protein